MALQSRLRWVTVSACSGRFPVRDPLRELRAAALELHRRVSSLALGDVDLALDRRLLELEEVELHRLAASGLALGANAEIGHYRHEVRVVARQALKRGVKVRGEPVPRPRHH